MQDGRKNKHINILRSDILEAPFGYFDDLLEFSEEEFDAENLDSGIDDEDDFDIDLEYADVEGLDIETGELGNDPDEEFFADVERAAPQQADIEFFINADGSIGYAVDLGNLSFSEKVVNPRLYALTSLAEFLIEKQERFLRSPDIKTAYENLRSFQQKDFLMFHNKKYSVNKKGDDWLSRALKYKNIQVPFSLRLIPVSDFFDDQWETVVMLKTAIDYHLDKNPSNPLGASEQSRILYYVTSQKHSVDKVKRIWLKLKLIFDEKDWRKIRLDGGQGTRYRNAENYLQEIAKYVREKRESAIDTYEPE